MTVPPLEAFGQRIVIMGPSNSGKSTLADTLSTRLGVPAVHLDVLRHLPDTDWKIRPHEHFAALHNEAVLADGWVMDGNYSVHLPVRFVRATGVIVLWDNRWANLARYFRRTLFQRQRAGALPGARDSVKWSMIHWILVATPPNQHKYRKFAEATGLPMVMVRGMGQLKALYRAWNLPNP